MSDSNYWLTVVLNTVLEHSKEQSEAAGRVRSPKLGFCGTADGFLMIFTVFFSPRTALPLGSSWYAIGVYF